MPGNAFAMARFCIFVWCWLAYAGAVAQVDTTLALEMVTVSASRYRSVPVGQQVQSLDSARLQALPGGSLADILQQGSGVFIRSYGLGGLATSSIRGGSAQQTAVIWNGFPIQNPMLGQLDLSLLPLALLDEVQIAYGGSSALWGSGAVGGALQLNNHLPQREGWQWQYNSLVGSFAQWHQAAKVAFANEKFATATRFIQQSATNDFPYRVAPDAPTQRQTNADFRQKALLQENRWQIRPNQSLQWRTWLSDARQHIPPTTVQTRSVAEQDNRALRTALDWQLARHRWIFQARTGLFYDFFHFRDALAGVDAPSRSWMSISEAETQWQLRPEHHLHFGVHHTYANGFADGYPEGQQQQQSALFAAYKWQSATGRWRARTSLRQGVADGAWLPIVPAFAIENSILKHLIIKANVQRNFRLPTLNDLYWQPGGNPALRPEQGWSQELTLQTHHSAAQWSGAFSITGFHRQMDDWILWTPGARFWSPQNVLSVRSRGIEQRLELNWQSNHWQVRVAGGYDQIYATQERATNPVNLGKQLIYVPEQQAFARIAVHYSGWQLVYQHQYTGSVFIRSDNTAALPAYRLGWLHARYDRAFSNWRGAIFINIQNLWDEEYRVIERRRMPGRSWQLGIALSGFH